MYILVCQNSSHRRRKYQTLCLLALALGRIKIEHAFQYAFWNTGLSVMIVYKTITNYQKITHTNTLIQHSTCTQIPIRPCRNHKIFTIHASKPIMVLMCLCESRKRERGISERRNCLQMCDSRTKEKIKNTVFINQNKTNNKLCYWCV